MLLWTTDIHLDFLPVPEGAKMFAQYLAEENPNAEALLITGDISIGSSVVRHLKDIAEVFVKPVYFVLGNHDYYYSSFKEVDQKVRELVAETPNLHLLNDGWHEYHGIPIVGVGGWYDAYYGNTYTKAHLTDFYEIRELIPGLRYHDLLLQLVRDRAGKETDQLAKLMKEACETDSDTVIVATHVAPYGDAAWYCGKPSERDMMPWFSSASTGAVLDTYADKYPEKTFVVLCGHCHSSGIYQRRDNMIVYTGRARYRYPDLAGVINEGILWAYDSTGQKVERPLRPDGLVGKRET
jgi:predicted phosphohydrolase